MEVVVYYPPMDVILMIEFDNLEKNPIVTVYCGTKRIAARLASMGTYDFIGKFVLIGEL